MAPITVKAEASGFRGLRVKLSKLSFVGFEILVILTAELILLGCNRTIDCSFDPKNMESRKWSTFMGRIVGSVVLSLALVFLGYTYLLSTAVDGVSLAPLSIWRGFWSLVLQGSILGAALGLVSTLGYRHGKMACKAVCFSSIALVTLIQLNL